MDRQRFLSKSLGDNLEGTKRGIIKLLQILSADGYKTATIVVPTIGRVKDTMLVDALGEPLSKELIKERYITLEGGKTLKLCGQATLKNFKYEDAYLGLWASKFMIDEIESLPTWRGLVIVSWLPGDYEEWLKKNEVTVIYDDGQG